MAPGLGQLKVTVAMESPILPSLVTSLIYIGVKAQSDARYILDLDNGGHYFILLIEKTQVFQSTLGPYGTRVNTDCFVIMAGNWRETGVHHISCIKLVYFVSVAYKFDQRI